MGASSTACRTSACGPSRLCSASSTPASSDSSSAAQQLSARVACMGSTASSGSSSLLRLLVCLFSNSCMRFSTDYCALLFLFAVCVEHAPFEILVMQAVGMLDLRA